MGKPVEWIYIPDGLHPLQKPLERIASQEGNVDWFRFWLKGEEDSDPGKADQYRYWRELRDLQESQSTAKPNLILHGFSTTTVEFAVDTLPDLSEKGEVRFCDQVSARTACAAPAAQRSGRSESREIG